MPFALKAPDGSSITSEQAMQLMSAPQFRFAGMNEKNWIHFAADEIQKGHQQREQQGAPRLSAKEQLAIQDSFRSMAGLSPISNIDMYRTRRTARMAGEGALAHAGVRYMEDVGQGANRIYGLFDPEGASEQARKIEQTYMSPKEGVGSTVGSLGATITQMLPAIASGGSSLAAQGAVLGATFGAPAAGDVRMQSQQQRQAFEQTGGRLGRDVSGWEELSGAVASGALEMVSGKISAMIGTRGLSLFGKAMPQLAAAFGAGGKTALRSAIGNLLKVGLGAVGEGTEESLTELVGNHIAGGTVPGVGGYDPEASMGNRAYQGMGEAFGMGALSQLALAPFGIAGGGKMGGRFNAGPQQIAPTQGAQATQSAQGADVSQELQIAKVVQKFLADPKIPDGLKAKIQARVDQASDAGVPIDIEAVIADVQEGDVLDQAASIMSPEEAVSPVTEPSPSRSEGEGDLQQPAPVSGEKLAYEDWLDSQPDVDHEMLSEDPALQYEYERAYEKYLRTSPEAAGEPKPKKATVAPPKGKKAPPVPTSVDEAAKATGAISESNRIVGEMQRILDESKGQAKGDVVAQAEGIIAKANAKKAKKAKKKPMSSAEAATEGRAALEDSNKAIDRMQKVIDESKARTQRVTKEAPSQQEMVEPPQKAPKRVARRPGPEGSPQAQRMYNLTVANKLTDMTMTDRNELRSARKRENQAELVKQVQTDQDIDAALMLTASNMGDVRRAAVRAVRSVENSGRTSDMTVDDLATEGAAMFLQAVRGEKSLSATGRKSRIGDLSKWDPKVGSLSTFLIGGSTRTGAIQRRLNDLAQGPKAGVKARTAAPRVRSTEAFAEKAGEAGMEELGDSGVQQRRIDEQREALEDNEKPMSEAGQDLVATAKAMLAEGKTQAEVEAWVKKQAAAAKKIGVDFLPDAVDRMAKGDPFAESRPARELTSPSQAAAVRDAKSYAPNVKPVYPTTQQEVDTLAFSEALGLDAVLVTGLGRRAGVAVHMESVSGETKTVLLLSAGRGVDAAWDLVAHESSHGLGLDRRSVADEATIREAEKRYLALVPADMRSKFRSDPARLRREAIALIHGEVMGDPRARRALFEKNPTLYQRVINGIQDFVRRMVEFVSKPGIPRHQRNVVQSVLDGFTSALAFKQGVMYSSVATTFDKSVKRDFQFDEANEEVETDVKKFVDTLNKVLAEKPKETGRPELANPMDTEQTRRLMDYLDEMRKAAGKPAKQGDSVIQTEAKAILKDKTRSAQVKKMAQDGMPLLAAEVLAAKEMLNVEAAKVFKKPTLTNILAFQKMGTGYRKVGTETARALRIRYDKLKKPAERMVEYVTDGLMSLPKSIADRVAALEVKGKTNMAEKLRREYGARAAEMLADWQKAGIDVDNLTDAQAKDPRVYSKIIRDLQRLQYDTGAWDVVHEYRRNTLMYAPLTFMRNALGGFYSVADVFLTKPLARTLSSIVGKSRTGETSAAIHAWGSPIALSRAMSNAAMTVMYEVPQLETQISLHGGGTLKGVAETEIYSPAAITGKGTQKAIDAAMNVLAGDGSLAMNVGKAAKTLVSGLGRAVRVPQALNSAVDELFKTMHAHSEVAAHAVRIGKSSGLEVGTKQMQEFIDEQLANMSSGSWAAAVESEESWRVAFQSEAGAFERAILNATGPEWGTLGQFLRLMVPFRKTPIQLAGQALMHVPGVGLGRMAQRAVQSRTGGKAYEMDEATRHAAQQIYGMLGMALLWNLVDPDDDDENRIKLSGAASYSRKDRQERVTTQESEPYMGIRVGGQWYNYNYVEPLSQWVGTLATFISETKRAKKTGQGPGEAAKRTWRKIVGMYSDQTYIRTVGDILKVVHDSDAYTLNRMGVNFAASWLPNVVDSSMRDADPFIRERKVMGIEGERPSFGKQVMRDMYPTKNILPPPKVNFFGGDITVPGQQSNPTTMFMVRLLSPIQPRQTLKGKQRDVIQMIHKWNETQDVKDSVWFQEPSRKVTIRYPGRVKPVIEDMNENEYYWYAKLSGLLAAREVESRDWNVDNPTQRDMMKIETIFSTARSAAREYVKAARQYKAMGHMNEYRKTMASLRSEVKSLTK